MCSVVANEFKCLVAFGSNDVQCSVLFDHKGRIDHFAVHLASQSGLGKAWAYISGYVMYANRMIKVACGTVGKGNLWHIRCSVSGDPY